jgi:hypothetical protein
MTATNGHSRIVSNGFSDFQLLLPQILAKDGLQPPDRILLGPFEELLPQISLRYYFSDLTSIFGRATTFGNVLAQAEQRCTSCPASVVPTGLASTEM